MVKGRIVATMFLGSFYAASLFAGDEHRGDPHYGAAGFFDLHVCNWPEEHLFFLAVFSSYRFADIQSVTVYDTQDRRIGQVSLERYRLIRKKGKPEKRAFISRLPIPADAKDGWYRAEVLTRDGKTHHFRDDVRLGILPIASGLQPANNAILTQVPQKLTWDAVPGARYYKVYLRDIWNDGKVVFESKLVTRPEAILPKGLLQADGWYAWKVSARDSNEHPRLGDFNQGSLTAEIQFQIQP